MTLEEFKECFGDCSTIKKLDLLIENMDYLADDRESRVRAELRGDRKGEMYFGMEELGVKERVVWLYREIAAALERGNQ